MSRAPERRTSEAERKRRAAAVASLYAAATVCELYGRRDLMPSLEKLADEIGNYKINRRESRG